MADLVLLFFDGEEPVRCSSLDDAKQRIHSRQLAFSKASVEITPEGGGPILSLDFERISGDWVASA